MAETPVLSSMLMDRSDPLGNVLGGDGRRALNVAVDNTNPIQILVVGTVQPSLELELIYAMANPSYYKTFTYSLGSLSEIDVYTDNTLSTQLFSKTFTYLLGNLIQTFVTRIADGATLQKTFAYSGTNLVNITATYVA